MKKIKFDIQGMTCSSCSSHVERAVSKLTGIQSINVNLLSNNMVVEYDEQKIDNTAIIKAVKNAGYSASISEENKVVFQKPNKDNTLKEMRKKLTISIAFLIPLMFVAMHHMFGLTSLRFYK